MEFLEKKMPWVVKHLDIIAKREPVNLEKRYIAGEEHYHLGNKYILEVVMADIEKVEILGDKIIVHQLVEGEKNTERVYLRWLNGEVSKIFTERYKYIFPKFGYDFVPRVQVKNMKSRWGSYRSTGIISLNKKLIHAPISCLDYVITHELCHYKHMNHGKWFYGLLQKMIPNYKEEERRLKQYGKLTCL